MSNKIPRKNFAAKSILYIERAANWDVTLEILFRSLECTRQYSLQKDFESFLAFILQVSKNMEELILNKNEAAGSKFATNL